MRVLEKRSRLDLDRIVFIGRTYDEYVSMFDLDGPLLKYGTILDCPAGASSFAAEARRLGADVTSADILFDLPVEQLLTKGKADLEHVMERAARVPELYNWDRYEGPEGLRLARIRALSAFFEDYSATPDRYRRAELPQLPFDDGQFSIVLSGHFLFTYGDRLDFDFHVACLRELLRVSSREVRVFPLVGPDAQPYPRLDEILSVLDSAGVGVEVRQVPFEFQRGADKMLRLIH